MVVNTCLTFGSQASSLLSLILGPSISSLAVNEKLVIPIYEYLGVVEQMRAGKKAPPLSSP